MAAKDEAGRAVNGAILAKGGGSLLAGFGGPILAVGCGCLLILLIFVGVIAVGVYAINNPGQAVATTTDGAPATNWAGSTATASSIQIKKGGSSVTIKIPQATGKVGHEEHFRPKCEGGTHLTDKYSSPLSWISDGSCGSFGGGMTPSQERWYFNMRWQYTGSTKSAYRHAKLIVTNPVNGKRIVVSVEEYGPAQYVTDRNGINAGAPPDVYNYLGLGDPYTSPSNKSGYATWGFAEDQNIPLGPLN